MRVAVITTVRHNVGDDFVREGLLHVLQRGLERELEVSLIHKHAPITARYGFEGFRHPRLSKILDRLVPLGLRRDRILEAELVVQSGAPVYWCHPNSHCADNEWFGPLIEQRYLGRGSVAPLFNLAAGAAQNYFSEGTELTRCDRDRTYVQRLHALSSVTTVRDSVAQKMLNSIGLEAPLLPCTSIFAADRIGVAATTGTYVALNYMWGAGHYRFGQDIDPRLWERTFAAFARRLSEVEDCVLVCHNGEESHHARRIAPGVRTFFSNDYRDYLRFYAGARFGILNRVHGAFALASFGRPSFLVGTDSRATMASQIELEHAFVADVDEERLWAEYENLRDEGARYAECFTELKTQAYAGYIEAIRKR